MSHTQIKTKPAQLSDDEVEIVIITTKVAGTESFNSIYGNIPKKPTNQSLGPLGISEKQSLLPDPETDPEIKIEGGKDPQDEPKTNKQKTFCRIK